MRKSRVLRETRAGELAACLKINITHPAIIELAGLANASAVWLCNEHVPNDWSAIEHCVRAAKIHDMDVIVRVSKGSYSDYIRPFEADATAIMVPHVTSAAEARHIVETCRFHPLGTRALDSGNVDGAFCQIPMAEYIAESNREKYLILQIESPEAVEVIDEIAAVPGYDFLLFGPGDYSHRIGDAGNIQHPEVLAARRKVEEAARKHGKQLFSVAAGGTPEEMLARGYTIASVGSDVFGLGEAFRQATAKTKLAPVASQYSQP
jgi:4-hydroxy-2-oxoheptanedioate aldolase